MIGMRHNCALFSLFQFEKLTHVPLYSFIHPFIHSIATMGNTHPK